MPGSMRRFSGTLEHPPPRQNPMDRRHSNASDTSLPDTSHVRQLSQENVEYIPTRLTKVTAPKPAANPLQFIKVGPASLYKSAQEQLKKVEEIKKVKKEVRDEAEDWQSNLDNWKSSRRKRQEHIIERVVEVKKIEMEEYDRNRRRSKTFSEMMEERNSRGRKTSLVPVLYDDDANDLSDLGISASSGRNFISDGYDHDNHQNNREKEDNDNHNYNKGNNGHIDDDGSSATTFSSPEPEEYTYERAIQGYVNYAETRAKSRTPATKSNKNNSSEETETEKLSNGHGKGLPPSPPHTPRRQSAAKIEEKLSALEKRRRSSTEINNSVNKDLKMPLAKGEILKRRAMFELANDLSEFASKPMRRLSSDTSSKTKQCNKANSADSKENNRLSSGETSPIKEKQTEKATNGSKGVDSESKQRLSNGDLSSTPTIQERLSNLEKQNSVTERKEQISENCVSESIKDRLSNLDSSCNKEINRKVTPDRDPSFKAKLANFKNTDEPEKVVNGIDNLNKHTKGPGADSERSSSPEEDVIYETKRQSFHQSLDSLDVEGSSDAGNEAFERVHSLEDLDCCSNARNYPASASSMEMLAFSSQSGDTDREDSGIHTADVSCSVSQADEPVEDGEIVATINSVIPHLETNSSGADVYHLEVEIVNQKQAQSPVSVSSSGMNEPTEMSTAFLDVKSNNDCSIGSSSSSPIMEGELSANQPTYSKNNVETSQMEQDALISTSRMGPEESNIYSEKSELPNDSKATIVNSETTVKNETINSKDCTDNQQLPSIENSVQHFHTEVRKDVTAKPLLNSVSEDEVFLPISTSKILPLELSSDVEIVAGLAYPLRPPTSTEPPKEKPPPPPTELNDEELPPKTSLKRLDSTKRIKKEIWRKRSDFLGIDGGDDESYLEPELKVAPPPDMTTFLVEERRSEQQLYRQSICSETDSNHGETTESRDSGVELDRAHSDDWNGKLSSTPEILSAQHSRQNSDIYGTASITSEEDEIMKKEREIIEILEKEEQWRYRNNTTAEESDIGEKLAVKLHQLEQEKMRLEWERTEEENKRQMKENARRDEELRLQAKEQELRQQESLVASPMTRPSVTGKEERIVSASGEALQAERERLQRENEELQRQKETLQLRESQQLQHSQGQMQQHWGSTTMLPHQQWSNEAVLPMTHLSLQDISMAPAGNINSYSPSTVPMVQSSAPLNYRLSLPDLQQEEQIQNQQLPVRPTSLMPTPRANPNRRPPPPIPPAKPLRVVSQEQRERENSIRNSRMPSADSIPQHVETTHVHHGSVPAHVGSQPISRQTLQALSAVPRSRFIANDMWMQPKKKPENQRNSGRESSYNYQHWLIQEAEHRRITEQQQRTAVSPRKSSPPHPHTSHQSPWGTSQPQHRQEKPLPDAIIQTLTQRVQNRVGLHDNKSVISSRRRIEESTCRDSQQVTNTGHISSSSSTPSNNPALSGAESQEKMLSVSGKKKCSHCGEELGRGAAMIIESLRLFYHIDCFKCCVCHVQLGDGLMGTDVRVRNNKLHCHNCYSSDDGVKFSCV